VRRDNARGFDPAGFPDWPLTQRFPIGGFAFLLPLFLLPAKRFPDWQKLLQAVKDADLVLEVPDLNDKVMFGDATLSMFPLDYPENQEIAGMLIGCRRPIGGPFNTQCCVFFAGPPLVCKVKK
jgi:hypothetical protein